MNLNDDIWKKKISRRDPLFGWIKRAILEARYWYVRRELRVVHSKAKTKENKNKLGNTNKLERVRKPRVGNHQGQFTHMTVCSLYTYNALISHACVRIAYTDSWNEGITWLNSSTELNPQWRHVSAVIRPAQTAKNVNRITSALYGVIFPFEGTHPSRLHHQIFRQMRKINIDSVNLRIYGPESVCI